MVTLGKKLLYCLAFLMFVIGFTQDADAVRFGLNTGFYKEGIKTSCAHTGEFGLKLGLYFDRSTNDMMYMAAKNGISLCDMGCGCGTAEPLPVQPVNRSCQSLPPVSPYQFQNALAPSTKTEIYLLVLPETRTQQPVAYYPPQAQPQYYGEPVEYGRPVRGMW